MRILVLVSIGWLVLGMTVQAASFDCGNAASKTEKLICGNGELSKLDDALNKAYRQALEQSDDKQWATQEQKDWLRGARNVCKDVKCLKNTYLIRIAELTGTRVQSEGLPQAQDACTPKCLPPKRTTTLCTPASRCDKVMLLYSEDDSICRPLLKVYQELWDKNKKDKKFRSRSRAHPSSKGYWEDYYPEVFAKAGFVPPPPLRDEQHMYVPTKESLFYSTGGNLASVFYRLRLDSSVAEQTVLIQDYPFHNHGDYSSDVYISKPGEDISAKCSLDYFVQFQNNCFGDACGYLEHCYNQFAFATDFREDNSINPEAAPHAETLIKDKYLFSKANTAKEFSTTFHGEIMRTDLRIDGGIAPLVQRVYLFHGQPIFTARNVGRSIVYRIKNGAQIDDICYFATNAAKIPH